MFEIIVAGGWLMLPILCCSVLTVAIVIERLWSLGAQKVMPKGLLSQVWEQQKIGEQSVEQLDMLRSRSSQGEIFAAGLIKRHSGRDSMRIAMEETGQKVAHDLEHYLAVLATVAAVAPLLGLLGTVIGMIEVFTQIMVSGSGDTGKLAGGISTALITTAFGIGIAIPAMIFHKFFERRIDNLLVAMEQQSANLVDAITNLDTQSS